MPEKSFIKVNSWRSQVQTWPERESRTRPPQFAAGYGLNSALWILTKDETITRVPCLGAKHYPHWADRSL